MGYYHSFNRSANTVTVSRFGANAGFVNYIDVDFYHKSGRRPHMKSLIPLGMNAASFFVSDFLHIALIHLTSLHLMKQ